MPNLLRRLIAATAVAFTACAASAAPVLQVNGSGILTGATGVIVNGTSYNVQFIDGSCVAVFNGCDATSDFTFQSFSLALAASQALLNQVFLDGPAGQFDSGAALTAGCSATQECLVHTPYAYNGGGLYLTVYATNSTHPGGIDGTSNWLFTNTRELATLPADVFAVWSLATNNAVPEPASFALIGAALAAAGLARRRKG